MSLKLKSGTGLLALNASGKLSCACCCYPTCPEPVIQWDSRSASKTKSGWRENGSPSPLRFFKAITASGTITRTTSDWCGSGCDLVQTYAHSGTSTYDPITGVVTDGMSVERCDTIGGVPDGCWTGYISLPINNSPSNGFYPWGAVDSCQPTRTDSALSSTVQAPGIGGCADITISGSATKTLALVDEYTTSELLTNASSDLPAFDGDWNDTAGSFFSLTSDEVTVSIREAKYRFRFTIPEMCGETPCYQINWLEDGVAKSWAWGGSGVAGDIAYSPEYTIAVPSTNKTATVTGIEYSCSGCA